MRGWVALVLVFALGADVEAQFSGSSFGGSRGFGGGGTSSSSSSSSSSWGSSSSSSYSDDSAQRERERRERQAAEERRRAEQRALEAERERARLEAERLERERVARALARDRALPLAERARLGRFGSTAAEFPIAAGLADPSTVPMPARPPVPWTLQTPVAVAEHAPRPMAVRMDWINGGLCAGPSFLFFALVALFFRRRASRREVMAAVARAGGGHVPAWSKRRKKSSKANGGSCELRRISIAFDWTQRKKLQQVLENVGTRHNVQSEHGMFAAAQEVARILAAALPGARYAMWESRYAWPNDAEKRFFAMASDLKARYRYDPARGQQGPEGGPKAEEGRGLGVVSMVLGATRRFTPLPDRLDPGSVAQALTSSLSISSRELVAVDVVWSPALERDRMSSAEMVEVYPELLPLANAADLGRVQCTHCSGIFAGELERCPVCGAPR